MRALVPFKPRRPPDAVMEPAARALDIRRHPPAEPVPVIHTMRMALRTFSAVVVSGIAGLVGFLSALCLVFAFIVVWEDYVMAKWFLVGFLACLIATIALVFAAKSIATEGW